MAVIEIKNVVLDTRAAIVYNTDFGTLVYFNKKNNTDTPQDYYVEVPEGEYIVRARNATSNLFEEWTVKTIDYESSVCTSIGAINVTTLYWKKPSLLSRIKGWYQSWAHGSIT